MFPVPTYPTPLPTPFPFGQENRQPIARNIVCPQNYYKYGGFLDGNGIWQGVGDEREQAPSPLTQPSMPRHHQSTPTSRQVQSCLQNSLTVKPKPSPLPIPQTNKRKYSLGPVPAKMPYERSSKKCRKIQETPKNQDTKHQSFQEPLEIPESVKQVLIDLEPPNGRLPDLVRKIGHFEIRVIRAVDEDNRIFAY